MKSHSLEAEKASPARRLGILYFVSHTSIAIVLALVEVNLLKDLELRRNAVRSITQAARQEALDTSLCQSILSVLAGPKSAARRQNIETLLERIERDRRGSAESGEAGAGPGHASAAATSGGQLSLPARAHRIAALDAATSLVTKVGTESSAPALAAETSALIQTLITEEDAERRALGESMLQFEQESAIRLDKLESIEFALFVAVLIVLLMEGIYVIGPAMNQIQAFVNDARRSNEEQKSYAARLERSNKELQDFASVASHDLQEPLRKVQAFSDRLRSKCGAALDDSGRDYLDRIQNAGKRMQTLINDLLTFSRVTTKAQPFVSTDLNGAARDVICDLEVRIEQVGGRVELGDLPTVDADPLQMRQLMQNLIGNALKYHRAQVPPVVHVFSKPVVSQSRELCQILVEDNGIGFEEVYADRIFTIFQRLHGRTEYEGTGVGLAVCRKIAERHGGSITARSTPGEGSSFMVTLPVRQPREAVDVGISN
jgi:signal transduction histidine kinase